MRNRKHVLKLNDKGASMVTVILTIAFITILVSVVMMTSLINYRMKRVNVYAKDTFYSAEQVLDEINLGLQRYMSDSLSEAYMQIMENYNDFSLDVKRDLMQTRFYESMWEKLEVANMGNSTYDTNKLYDFLRPATKWRGGDEGYGALVGVLDASGTLDNKGVMETYEDGIVLKNLRVYYKDSKGFVSIIQTDIRLTYPEIDFATTTSLPNVASYGFIANSGLTVNGATPLALEGNFFADSLLNADYNFNDEVTKKLVHSGNGKVIIKHDMELRNASFTNETDGTLWAEEIKTISGDLNLNGETLLADDLDIGGDYSKIKITGIFNGYGTSMENADASSAILVNGSRSDIDFSGVEKLTVAGHSFVGTSRTNTPNYVIDEPEENEVDDTAEANDNDTDNNIYTGESIAIKSNQLMYLVPPECIGVYNVNGKSLYNKNPLTREEYETIQGYIAENPNNYTDVSITTQVAKLGGASLAAYIHTVNGVAQVEKVFVPTNDDALVYYYMKFPNEELANEYFKLYYNTNKETYDRYIRTYLSTLSFPNANGIATIRTAGHGIIGEYNPNDGYDLFENTIDNASAQLSDNQSQYQNRFAALCTRLVENYEELAGYIPPDPNATVLFDNIVNETELNAYIDAVQPGYDTVTLAEGQIVLSKSPTYTVNDGTVHLVISGGDVVINIPNFEGTVIAKGKVTVTDMVNNIKVNETLVNTLMRHSEVINGSNVMVAHVLQDGEDYVFAIQNQEGNDKEITSMSDLIIYENWKKE